MQTDIRKEQIALLRFEKQVVALAASLATIGVAAASAKQKLSSDEIDIAYTDLQNALMSLAETTTNVHEALNANAISVGAKMLEASGGLPKSMISGDVASIFGLG